MPAMDIARGAQSSVMDSKPHASFYADPTAKAGRGSDEALAPAPPQPPADGLGHQRAKSVRSLRLCDSLLTGWGSNVLGALG